ncbi:MAG: putative phytase [Pseudomonadota bacterium]|jgi:hypothetical protein
MTKFLFYILFFLKTFLIIDSLHSAEKIQHKHINELHQDWHITSLINEETNANKTQYRLVASPDGIGVLNKNNDHLSIFVNHEISSDQGVIRSHGSKGAFVSEWTLDIGSKKITSGNDLIKKVKLWDRDKNIFKVINNTPIHKLCSGDLPDQSAFFDTKTMKGFKGRFFLSGEEDRNGGRAFAHIVSGPEKGTSYELPYLGKSSWENLLAHPKSGEKTIVMGMDDNKDGQVYLYIGEKKSKGNPVERAGLMYGVLYGIKVISDRFNLVELGDVSQMSGSDIEQLGIEKNITQFKRPEDGAWDTLNKNVFYFATTDKIDGMSQIFQLTFDDINNPKQGGSIQSILNASEIGAQMFDNITVSDNGKILINEDPGNHEHLASIWELDPLTKKATKLFSVKPEFFQDENHPNFLTMDEEHSGIVEITKHVTHAPWYKKNERYFLGTLQIHKKINDPELIELGELYLISGPN